MKTALICMLQLHKSSGSARTALENIKFFKQHGYKVHVASMTMDKKLLLKEGAILHKMLPWIKSTGVHRRRWYNWQVQRLQKKLKPDITVGHGDILEQDVLTLHNCVFLASELIHGRPLPSHHEMAQIHGQLLKQQSFQKMIANSQIMKTDTIQRFAVPSEKIEVVYPALNTSIFKPNPTERPELRKRFHFSDKVVVALVTSGNFKKRGLDIFTEAIEALPQEVQELADFRVVGKDKKPMDTHALVGFDPGLEDIQSYYQAIDVFVLPARIEEFGRVVLEAMGCGVPIITTDKVGASELLEEESREFVIPSHSSDALMKAMKKLVLSSELRAKLGSLNAQTALKYSEEHVYSQFKKIFLSL